MFNRKQKKMKYTKIEGNIPKGSQWVREFGKNIWVKRVLNVEGDVVAWVWYNPTMNIEGKDVYYDSQPQFRKENKRVPKV